jgi:16S rRNA (adenine1518-N6/adenine1519-N6)-dimethyltransferase
MNHPRQVLKEANIFANKELGQNFLSSAGIADMIVEKTGISQNAHVLEIGPGLGALTFAIAKKAAHISVIEKDRRLIPLLNKEIKAQGINNIKIFRDDILKINIKQLVQEKKLIVLGNLPYNISSQILVKLIKEREYIDKVVLMFQKEMADRILSSPGTRDYSRLSVLAQYAADISLIANINPSSFFPKPKVNSTVLKFNFFKPPGLDNVQEALLFNIIKAAFSKRRKTLKNSMAGGEMMYEKQFVLQALTMAGIDATRRAETLSVEEFKKIMQAVWALNPVKA